MKPIISNRTKNNGVVIATLALTILALGAVSCAYSAKLRIMPKNSDDTLALSSDDIVRIMRRAGFNDQRILDHGEDLHYALSESGAAEIWRNKRIIAVFAIKGDSIYISTLRGNAIYNINSGWVFGGGNMGN